KMTDLGVYPRWAGSLTGQGVRPPSDKSFLQVVGDLKVAARPVIGEPPDAKSPIETPAGEPQRFERGKFIDHPLVVTGLCGQGAVTLVTFDVAAQELTERLAAKEWLNFWNYAAG